MSLAHDGEARAGVERHEARIAALEADVATADRRSEALRELVALRGQEIAEAYSRGGDLAVKLRELTDGLATLSANVRELEARLEARPVVIAGGIESIGGVTIPLGTGA